MSLITVSSRVTLHFELSLEDGQIVDTNFDKAPASFVFGDGSLLPAFEEALLGMTIDQEATFVMSPEKAFGVHNESNIQRMPRSQFAMDLEEGMVVSFADMSKNELPGVIAEIGEKDVVVDFNHPLAGRSLTFKVRIMAIEDAA
ncbi:peptidyl-prolyl cis-trans isomerase [Marinomonas ushuaiensis DSM 15871]|uniref:Peptidyl-prolyl cis-trans isomerase n=1 Tax=Marinomonas ushuaiensis DSM 15871 TaxID=1122207 RepID=X7E1R9_9GAMM|nr:peptidylprolyl isomerase [Marinomonas ushuaiensis]ETX10009.1 peptidyl-prolyl cis-trans isomerase [Marinomonas ushuaiensis DSM 15871]